MFIFHSVKRLSDIDAISNLFPREIRFFDTFVRIFFFFMEKRREIDSIFVERRYKIYAIIFLSIYLKFLLSFRPVSSKFPRASFFPLESLVIYIFANNETNLNLRLSESASSSLFKDMGTFEDTLFFQLRKI